MDRRILVVHEDEAIGGSITRQLAKPEREIKLTQDGTSALELLVERQFAVALVSLRLPDIDGIELAREVSSRQLPVELVLLADRTEAQRVGDSLEARAYAFLSLPVDSIRLDRVLEQALSDRELREQVEQLEQRVSTQCKSGDFAAVGRQMREILDGLAAMQPTPTCLRITGERGTGKSRLAKHLHENVWRSRGELVTLACDALPDSILERELAPEAGRNGLAHPSALVRARGGTLVLDEVQGLSNNMQARLAAWLANDRTTNRSEDDPNGVRLLALSSVELGGAAEHGTFRGDLLGQLGRAVVILPPLRDRDPGDFLELTNGYLGTLAEHGSQAKCLVPEALACLMHYHWPGNVRELEQMLELLVVTSDGTEITPYDLPDELAHIRDDQRLLHFDIERRFSEITRELRDRIERLYLCRQLTANHGRIGSTAEGCGLSRRALYSKLKYHNIDKSPYRPGPKAKRRR
jgi:DNA-binding NtrC family response regulator